MGDHADQDEAPAMTKVFFSGSRRLAKLNRVVRERADAIIAKGFTVLAGDADGADAAMQGYLSRRQYEKVIVFCTGPVCRNNVGHWPTRQVTPEAGVRRGFRYYALKDDRMAEEATYGFVMWDGRSKGTFNNIVYLLGQSKKVLVYFSPSKTFHCLATRRDLASLLADSGPQTLAELERQLRIKKDKTSREKQLTLT